jgi:hypothetical protein
VFAADPESIGFSVNLGSSYITKRVSQKTLKNAIAQTLHKKIVRKKV